MLCGFFRRIVFDLFTGGSTALGVAGEEVFEFLDALVFVDLAHRSEFTGKAREGLFEQLAFGIGLLRLAVRAVKIADHFGHGQSCRRS